ncbi:DUF4097 family beta strand repeat protein [Tumebacillus sp. ITR2]|uniref:DUF4097 family beta strand repeat protein n=1 Tax=Tumebacillus amylolyticus TaxID=2801339 RepID=A0ABS1JB43_9BACL|nr:DUF4097 family beta strand repeat-containing protein [Tumebacillus amylolyticus]MBL0387498.1 DUF4097 family beta strand repeat protein [Tumebacillus amylolyticus]
MLKALLGLTLTKDETKTVELTPVAGTTRLNVHIHNGEIAVRTWDQPHVQAEIRVRIRGDEKAPMENFWKLRQFGSEVKFEQEHTHSWFLGPHVRIDVTLNVPAALTSAYLKTHNGFIEVEMFNGDVDAHTSNGALRIVDVEGKVEAHTHNGHVEILRIDGPVDVTSHNGMLDLDKVTEKINAHTHNGQVLLRDCGQSVTVSTHNGQIKVNQQVQLQGTWSLNTSNGSVEMRVPTNTDAMYKLHTSAGRITGNALPVQTSGFSQKLTVTTGQGTNLIDIHTSAGGIEVNHS